MKLLAGLIITTSLFTTNVFACSCEFTYNTPQPYEIANFTAKSIVGQELEIYDSEVVEYKQTVEEYIYGIGKSDKEFKNGGSECKTLIAGKKALLCTEKFRGTLKTTFVDNDCYMLIKVKRRKNNYSSKIIKNTCL
ncbi:hypothetical protein N9N67_09270 [Bacteriovoracaceae bacterium]|nr:hypothetical protein [Bacteriovoracaceae bacterium]